MKYKQPTIDELPTTKELLKSTMIALVSAVLILITVVLPAEYAIDPTRIGSLLGLTQMGEIKTQLAKEAKEAEERKNVQPEEPAKVNEESSKESVSDKSDKLTVKIPNNEGTEIKAVMKKDEIIEYTWKTEGGPLNFNSHGESTTGGTFEYGDGNNEDEKSGKLTAKFDGTHGWFWRNRSGSEVTLTLGIKGQYTSLKEVK